jgi:hypothetical protein
VSKNNNVRFDVNFACLFTILQLRYNDSDMILNNTPLTAAEVPAAEAELAYSIDRPWGVISVTTEAYEAYDLQPKLPVTEAYPSFLDASTATLAHQRHPLPGIHILVAGPEEWGHDLEPQQTTVVAYNHPTTLQLAVASGMKRDVADIDIAMSLVEMAAEHGLDDPDELTFTDQFGAEMSAEELRNRVAQQNTVLSLANATGSTVGHTLPNWWRNNYNATRLNKARNAGLLVAGAVIPIDALLATYEIPFLDTSLPLVLGAGAIAWRAAKRVAEGANNREQLWQRNAAALGRLVRFDLIGMYLSHTYSTPDTDE